jgi:hypothetical protein
MAPVTPSVLDVVAVRNRKEAARQAVLQAINAMRRNAAQLAQEYALEALDFLSPQHRHRRTLSLRLRGLRASHGRQPRRTERVRKSA